MKKKYVRGVALLCAMAMVLGGCGPKKQKAEPVEAVQETASVDTSAYLAKMEALLQESQGFLKQYDADISAGGDEGDVQSMRALASACDTYEQNLQGTIDSLQALGTSGDSAADSIHEALAYLLSEQKNTSADTRAIADYMVSMIELLGAYGDAAVNVSGGYDGLVQSFQLVNSLKSSLEAIDTVPAYLQDSHNMISQYLQFMMHALYEIGIGLENEQNYGYKDYMRMHAGQFEAQRVNPEFQRAVALWQSDATDALGALEKRASVQSTLVEEITKNLELAKAGSQLQPFTYMTADTEVTVSCDAPAVIYPALYNRNDYLVRMALSAPVRSTDVLISVEIPGFTQKYEKKVAVDANVTKLYIHPSVLSGDLALSSAKKMQVNISVIDAKTSYVYYQDTQDIQMMALNDISTDDESYGSAALFNFLAGLTPEAPELDQLKRDAITEVTALSQGQKQNLVGYQGSNTDLAYELISLLYAIGDEGVRYDTTSFSYSAAERFNQRIKFPAQVLENKSGLCVETSLLLASTLKSLGYNCFLVFPPNHCQVAVELLNDQTRQPCGDYVLIETTALPAQNYNSGDVIRRLTAEEWNQYLSQCSVIDCDSAKALNFQTLYN